MSVEEYLAKPGDAIRIRSGPYADLTAMVVSVHPDENYPAENSLVLVKLTNGRINSCYMSNLEKSRLPNDGGPSGAGERGGNS